MPMCKISLNVLVKLKNNPFSQRRRWRLRSEKKRPFFYVFLETHVYQQCIPTIFRVTPPPPPPGALICDSQTVQLWGRVKSMDSTAIFTLYSVNTPLIATPCSWRIGKALLCGSKGREIESSHSQQFFAIILVN